MAEPVIVPPAPTITQPSSPAADTSPGREQVQRAFHRVLPPSPPLKSKPPPPKDPPPPPKNPPKEPPKETPPPQQPKPEETDVPSFLKKALQGETPPT